jgi:ankyrin repeat protein
VTKGGQTACMDACRAGKVEVVEFLLASGAAINRETPLGRTPLMVAAMYSQMEARRSPPGPLRTRVGNRR